MIKKLCALALAAAGMLPPQPALAAGPGADVVRSPILGTLKLPDEAGTTPAIPWIDDGRESLRRFTEGIGRSIDGWFGDIPFDQGGRLVNGRLGLNMLWRRDDGFQAGLRFRGKFDLPNLKQKTYLYFGQDNERELVTDQPEAFTRQQRLLTEDRREDQTFFAGLGYALRDNLDLRGGIRGGLKPYVQARYSEEWGLTSADALEFRETLFWESSEGVGLTTALNYTHDFSRTLELRWRNAATLSQSTEALAWSSGLGLFVNLGGPRQLAFEALVNGETGSPVRVAEYGLRTTYRQAIYRDWLLGELILGHFWPKEDRDSERERTWAVGAGVEVLF